MSYMLDISCRCDAFELNAQCHDKRPLPKRAATNTTSSKGIPPPPRSAGHAGRHFPSAYFFTFFCSAFIRLIFFRPGNDGMPPAILFEIFRASFHASPFHFFTSHARPMATQVEMVVRCLFRALRLLIVREKRSYYCFSTRCLLNER